MRFDQIKYLNDIYYQSKVWQHGVTSWHGYEMAKLATDILMYSELIFRIQPDVIIESGTYKGGSAKFFADMCKLNGKGHVISVGNQWKEGLPPDKDIMFIFGDTLSEEVHNVIRISLDTYNDKVIFVSLDSAHDKAHVLKEISLYKDYVSLGSYMVVEDGMAIFTQTSSEANQAIDEFMRVTDEFVIDKDCEKFILTTNPNGWLKKIK